MTRPNSIIDIDRFFRIGDKNECWIWFGPRTGAGRSGRGLPYGQLKIKSKMHKAHRLMYEYFYGKKPGQFKVLHTCDNPLCVKPSHLVLGTQLDNIRDCTAKGRSWWCK